MDEPVGGIPQKLHRMMQRWIYILPEKINANMTDLDGQSFYGNALIARIYPMMEFRRIKPTGAEHWGAEPVFK